MRKFLFLLLATVSAPAFAQDGGHWGRGHWGDQAGQDARPSETRSWGGGENRHAAAQESSPREDRAPVRQVEPVQRRSFEDGQRGAVEPMRSGGGGWRSRAVAVERNDPAPVSQQQPVVRSWPMR